MSEQDYENICNFGQFFYPASKHYQLMGRTGNIIVNCDRCQNHNISACIGYGELDLCLKCANIITNDEKPSPLPTKPIMYKSDVMIKMKQDQFEKNREKQIASLYTTLMIQNQFEKKHEKQNVSLNSTDNKNIQEMIAQTRFGVNTRMVQSQFKK